MEPEHANASDAVALSRLRDDAARWQHERGIEQWLPGDVSLAQFEQQAEAGEWYLLRAGEPVAAVRLLRDDPSFWDEQQACTAMYVHGLVAGRTAPPGTGAALLRWAESEAAKAGCEVVRLDCLESNDALRRYYEQQGYVCVGRKAFPGTSVALYEKSVSG
jgi:GNAT superfamily N-acetyltransferase